MVEIWFPENLFVLYVCMWFTTRKRERLCKCPDESFGKSQKAFLELRCVETNCFNLGYISEFDDSLNCSWAIVENITHFPLSWWSEMKKKKKKRTNTVSQYDEYEWLWIIAKTILILIDQENYTFCVLIFCFLSLFFTSFMIRALLNKTTRKLLSCASSAKKKKNKNPWLKRSLSST